MTWSTVFLTRTSHSKPRQFLSCHLFICSAVFSCDQPTAVHWSPCDSAARTSDRPIWPVAPNIYTKYHENCDCGLLHDHLQSMLLVVGDCVRRADHRWPEALAVGDATQLRATDFGWRFRCPWAKDSKVGRNQGTTRLLSDSGRGDVGSFSNQSEIGNSFGQLRPGDMIEPTQRPVP
jgi:hypothetical protein